MIINKQDITKFRGVKVDGDLYMKRITNLHNPTGVFFEKYIDNETYEFLFFAVAAINDLGEIEDRKVFDGDSQESFFKAVDYFESLIENRIPEKANEPPSVGIFCFIKSNNKQPSFVDVGLQDIITIDKEDIEKVFTPPLKKKFGRLNMLEVDKPKYDVIKSKFALSFNEQLTNEYADKFEIEKDDIFVYKLTPYQNQPQDPNQPEQGEPKDVNDEELSLDKIEGEEPEKMKGEKEKPKKEEKNKKEDGDSEDGDSGDSGEEGDSGDSSEDGDGDGDGDEDSDEDGDGDGDGDSDEDGDGDGDGDGDSDSDEDGDGDGDSDGDSDSDEDGDGDGDGDGDSDGDRENQETNPQNLNERKSGDNFHGNALS